MTTNTKNYPTRVAVELNSMKGMIVLDQIRTVDKSRLIKIMGQLNSTEIMQCKAVIKETYVD
jgi:mRNA interferase MazF